MALDLSTLTTEQQLAAIYIGYYDRAADPVGEDFWEGAVANPNLSLADIATDFATQPETLIAYPFLEDPTAEQANAFIAEVYLNLFNRQPDEAGLEFWSDALLAAIDGTGALSVGEIILSIIEGAQDSAEGNDRTTILNKIEVATSWTDAAEAAAIDYTSDTAAQNSAKSIIEGVTDAQATVAAAKQTIDNFFVPAPVPGEEYLLTSATDVIDGTADDDEFNAYIQQNPFAGGISNSLSSADRLDGGAGNDRLYAELTSEIIGVSFTDTTDIQPRITNIEEIDIEARDAAFGDNDIVVDAKNINGHNEIGSYYSDGDLTIENLTTLTAGGTARNTSEITVTMDHTDNFNSDFDASDLEVYFDNDYLLSGQEAQGQIFYFLLDEDAELAGNPNRLNNIDVDGIRFTVGEGADAVEVTLQADAANVAGTHQGFVNALQAPLQALIADGTLPAGTTLTLDPTIVETTFIDDGSESDDIPAIVLTSGDGTFIEATGFSRIEEAIGEYDVFGRFRSSNEVEDQPISIDIDLHKAGRGGEGGDLIIGGKDTETADGIADGIEVFNINVLGAGNEDPNGGMTKPSDLGTITSTGDELAQVFIATDPVFAAGDSYASLTVRNGFDQNDTFIDTDGDGITDRFVDNAENGDLELINADAFLGDLTLGEIATATNPVTFAGRITNADTITAQGGGDVSLALLYDGNETAQAYNVTTGGGDDTVNILLDGDALDYAGSSLNVSTGGGEDAITVDFDLNDGNDVSTGSNPDNGNNNEQLNQAILNDVTIDAGSADDTITLSGIGKANIDAGSGDDFIDTSGDESNGNSARWAFNFDAIRAGEATGDLPSIAADELPGEALSYAYIGGATITVTLSGAGIDGDLAAGGGVMATDADDADGAIQYEDGYEASVELNELLSGNEFYGTQADINAAVMEAITEDEILSKLLSVTMGPNNTLIITSKTSGDFDASDLRIDIEQVDYEEASDWADVEAEARELFADSTIEIDSLDDANAVAPGDLGTSAEADAWYDGLSVEGDAANSTDGAVGEGMSNLHREGTASDEETDTVIDAGAGNDLIVLSTDAVDNTIPAFTLSGANALINGASNETIVLTGSDFGNDTVMNFTAGAEEGRDFLDFGAYLTSMETPSGSSQSERLITTTLDYGVDASPAGDIDANEVVVVRYENDPDDDDTFASLSASDIEGLFDGDDYDDGALDAADFDVVDNQDDDDVIDGDAKAILMVENEGNRGEYKVFELSWDASEDDGDEGVSANLLGSLDFGDSLGLDASNILDTAAYSAFLTAGGGTTGGGGTGGGGTATENVNGTNNAPTADDAVDETFVIEEDGTYTATITDFDPANDSLDFPDGATPAVTPDAFPNGEAVLTWTDGTDIITVELVGLTAAEELGLTSLSGFDIV